MTFHFIEGGKSHNIYKDHQEALRVQMSAKSND